MDDQLARLKSLNTIGVISYVLHLVVAVAGVVPGAQMGVGILLVALVIDLIKRPDAVGTWHESHFSWRLRTLLIAGVLYLVTIPLWLLLLPGMLAWWLISLWFVYRIIKGMVRMNAGQTMEV
ncbi:MAG: hypothetical protein Q7U45_08495 [Burkholderiaceae bacterium]|nr:hypothetical protein [Burkholderiaceae bacterium]MDZ4160948.1 hypothetical protein [Burkholderiales bacterium]